jgi:hypothetical protein
VKSRQTGIFLWAASICIALVIAGCGSSSNSDSGHVSSSLGGAGEASSTSGAEGSGGSSEGGEASSLRSGWTATALFEGGAPAEIERIERISCAAGPFCMVLSSAGESVTFDGNGFGSPEQISTDEAALYDTRDPVALSCASSTFCMMIGESYGYYIWDGSSWHSEGTIPSTAVTGPGSLSCPAEGECVAVEQGDGRSASVLVFADGTWSSVSMDPDGQSMIGLSCASFDYCQILGNDGDAFTFDAKTGEPPALDPGSSIETQIDSTSCVEGPYCLGADHVRGTVFEDHGRGFESQSGIPPLLEIDQGACGSAHFCLVRPVSSYQYAHFDGRKLQPIGQPPGNPELEYLSCTAEEICMASVAETDEAVVYSP